MLGITGTGIHEQTLISIDLLPQGSFFYWHYGQALTGLRVLKFDGAVAPRVLKFDSGYAAEGCGGRL